MFKFYMTGHLNKGKKERTEEDKITQHYMDFISGLDTYPQESLLWPTYGKHHVANILPTFVSIATPRSTVSIQFDKFN